MISKIVPILKKTSPPLVYKWLSGIYRSKTIQSIIYAYKDLRFKNKLRRTQVNHRRALEKIRKKKRIKVAYLLIHSANWKYEALYKLMELDDMFEPTVFICPYTMQGDEIMRQELSRTYESAKKQGYNVINTLNKETGEWLDIKRTYDPDIIFFTNPWNLTKPQYLITNYLNYLTCYVPYGFKNSYLYEAHFNSQMQNFVWKFFLETEIHKKLSKKYAQNKSYNTIVTGYPGMDKFLQKDYRPKDVWKIKDKKIKRIIWAPHHTIPGYGATLDYSTFLDYADSMLDIANRYSNKIQIAFKPHPILRGKLSKNEVWGKKKTDEYYRKWATLPNGQLEEGEYLDLFITSDGMIHDSSSFVIEYLYTTKPVMFLFRNNNISNHFNEIGRKAISSLYHGEKFRDIEIFINEVILNGYDKKYNDRVELFNSIIKPPNNISASENIFNYLKSILKNNNSYEQENNYRLHYWCF